MAGTCVSTKYAGKIHAIKGQVHNRRWFNREWLIDG